MKSSKLFTAPQQSPIPQEVFVNVNHMKESNGNQWWTVNLSRNPDDKPWDGIGVYTDKIEGRALYEAARLRHFFGQCEEPFILDFDTEEPTAAPSAPIEAQKSYTDGLETAEKIADTAFDSLQEPRGGWNLKDSVEAQYSGFQEAAKEIAAKIRALIPSTQAPKP